MPEHRGQGSGVRGQGSKAFSFRCEAGRAEILLYDAIDPWYGISAKQFHDELKALGPLSHIDLRINSPGGSITEGMAIHSILKRQTAKITAHIDGIAASMASIVAMAAGEIVMAQGAYLMIHNPLGYVVGEADDMRDLADLLDKMKQQLVNIYAARTRRPADEIAALMDTETWLTADEAIAGGFADRASPELALAAALDPQRFFHPPKNLCKEPAMADPVTPPALPPAASLSDLKAACPGADNDFYIAQLGNCATLEQSRAAWSARQTAKLDELTVRNEALGGEVTALKAELAALKARPGVAPVGGKPADDGAADADPLAAWNEAIAAELKAGAKTRVEAGRAAARKHPELRQAVLEAGKS